MYWQFKQCDKNTHTILLMQCHHLPVRQMIDVSVELCFNFSSVIAYWLLYYTETPQLACKHCCSPTRSMKLLSSSIQLKVVQGLLPRFLFIATSAHPYNHTVKHEMQESKELHLTNVGFVCICCRICDTATKCLHSSKNALVHDDMM